MKIGVPKEIKTNENRVALVPAGVEALVAAGHTVFVEQGAGQGSGFTDELYTRVGATIAPDADERVARGRDDHQGQGADRARMAADAAGARSMFTYFHFAADRAADARASEERRDVHRLRDRRAADARVAAADADVGGGGAHGGAGRRQVPREAVRRPRVLLGGVPGVPRPRS